VPRTRVKICGITSAADAAAAVTAGADALGLVFFAGSRRAVAPEQARAILAGLPAMVTAVALFVNAERRDVIDLCSALPLGLLQFHGDEEAAYCASFGRPWMKAIRVGDNTDIRAEVSRYPRASAILLDTFVAGVPGGTGEVFDWSRIPRDLGIPLILAGGLSADNVGTAIATAAPFAVDVSGGVESEPGVKSRQLIEDFVSAVRTADELKRQGSER
jgi:phosphoribosylanthranilate isomerase